MVKHSEEALCVIGELCRIHGGSGFIRLYSGCKMLAVQHSHIMLIITCGLKTHHPVTLITSASNHLQDDPQFILI